MDIENFRLIIIIIAIALVVAVIVREKIRKKTYSSDLDNLDEELERNKESMDTHIGELETIIQQQYNESDALELPIAREVVAQQKENNQPAEKAKQPPKERVIVINLMAKSGQQFRGHDIVVACKQAKLKLGKNGIFSCVATYRGQRITIFSVVNVMEPGIFNMNSIKALSTPGLSMFLQIPCVMDSLVAFDEMVNRAVKLQKCLDAELYNASRQLLKAEGLRELRQQVEEHRQQCLDAKEEVIA